MLPSRRNAQQVPGDRRVPRDQSSRTSSPSLAAVLVIALAALAPLVIYFWVMVTADRDARLAQASNRNEAVAGLVAHGLEDECRPVVTALTAIAGDAAIQRAVAESDIVALGALLRKQRVTASGARFVAVLAPGGAPLTVAPSSAQPIEALRRWEKALSQGGPKGQSLARYAPESRLMLFRVPVRHAGRPVGALIAGMPLDRMTELLLSATVKDSVTYVEDVEGQVVAASTMSEDLQQGMSGAVPPGRRFRTVAEMAAAARPEVLEPATREVPAAQCTVYTLSPVSTVLAPTNYLTMRLSVLLLPILAMYSVGVWHRLRTVRLAEAEARARAAEADALRPTEKAKSDFLADASHSLRTPLASMHVSLSGLLDEAVKWSPEELRATLEILDRETYRLSAQVRNLLDMSRLQAEVAGLCREPCDLTALVSSALERVEPLSRGRVIRAEFPTEPLMVECDQEQIETVIVNLVENALKYSPDGTPLEIEGRAEGSAVVFSIRDGGPGLEAGEEERVFEKFFRSTRPRRAEGTGLGLAICKAVVEAHGGRIAARNREGGGAEFWFSLPALQGALELRDA